jgi:hypothetical protein
MDKVDILVIATLVVLIWYRPILRRSRKNPHNDLYIDRDRVRDVLEGNRTWIDDPLFFLRRL